VKATLSAVLARITSPAARGPVAVALGTALLGVSGYVFITLTAAVIDELDYAAIASLYLLVALAGPGLFVAIEQETTRLVSHWQTRGDGLRVIVAQIGRLAAGLLGAALVALLVARPWLVERMFGGHASLWWALVISVIGYAGVSLLRGLLAGQRRLVAYGGVVGTEGLVRVLPCLILAAAGVASVGPYGLVMGLGSVGALILALVFVRAPEPGPGLPWRPLVVATGWLIAASGLSLAMANVAPVVVTALMPDERVLAGVFTFVFVLARIPLFLLYAAQPVLIPMLTRAVAQRDLAGLRTALRRAGLVVGALAALCLPLTAPICQWLADQLVDHDVRLSSWTITALALGTVLAMMVQVLQPALLAVASHRVIALAWIAGSVCFAVAFLLPVHPVSAAVIAQLAAGAVTLAVMAVALRLRLQAAADAVEDAGVDGQLRPRHALEELL
jgi:O-antigen/teichoic acid export membrane protein